MQLDELNAFLAVAEAGSFSRAAEGLYITQPAVSKRIATLEQSLGAALFDRIGHSVSLTPAGQALLPRARAIVQDIEDTRTAVANLSGRVSGPLRLGTSHHIGLHRLPTVLRRFKLDYPDVQLDIRFMDSEAACHAVQQGHLELGVVTLPLHPPQHLRLQTIWDDPLYPVVSPDHPLGRRKNVAIKQLAAHDAVLPGPGTFTRAVLDAAWRRQYPPLRVALSTNYLETIKMLVSVGLGWSILPATMIDEELHKLHIPTLRLRRTLGIVQHQRRTKSSAAQAFIAQIEQEMT